MKFFKNIFLAIAVAILASCDTIPLEKRTTDVDISAFKKPVVVVDFTGVACSNCPAAAELLKKMHEKAGDKLIAVAMYPDCSFNHTEFDLRTPEATQYYEAFGDLSKIVLPSGSVDFAPYAGKTIIDKDLWASAITARITAEPTLEVALENALWDATSKEVSFDATITAKGEISGNVSVIYWLIEDGIVGTQNYEGTYVSDYVHNHVLRKSLNGLWGENTIVSVGNDYQKAYKFTITEEKWNMQNCSIVAVVIDSDTKEILTANQIEL